MKNIILIGMMGCGKTTAGHMLAQQLGRPFVDCDELMEGTTGRTISQIFAQDGERGFRSLESQVLEQLSSQEGLVIATGGGAVLSRKNVISLRRNGIPEDFKYLCMAESGLNPEAVSPSGAGGLWQFMPATGREYGLKVGNQVDERFHIEKSTEAACRYLKKAYEKLGSWTLAAAAYNAGENGVVRRTGIQGTDSYYDTFLPQETMRYVYRILSLKLIASDPAAYGYRYRPEDRYPRLDDCREVAVGGRDISWSEVARRYGTNYKMLRLLNPWIRAYEYDNPGNETLQVKMPGQHFRTR